MPSIVSISHAPRLFSSPLIVATSESLPSISDRLKKYLILSTLIFFSLFFAHLLLLHSTSLVPYKYPIVHYRFIGLSSEEFHKHRLIEPHHH